MSNSSDLSLLILALVARAPRSAYRLRKDIGAMR